MATLHDAMATLQYALEKANCPLCNSQEHQFHLTAQDRFRVTQDAFTFVRCNACGLVYQNPRVTPVTAGIFYPAHYFKSRPWRNLKNQARTNRIVRKKCELIDKFAAQKGKLLEIGSANGDFLAALQEQGWQVEGVEVSSDAVEYSRTQHGLKVFLGELLERPDNGERFDVIVMWGVLPHIHNPTPTVSRAAELLSANGKLIVLCANIGSLAAERMGDQWGHLDLPRHYAMWSPDTLRRLYEQSGLRIDQIIHHDDIFNSNLVLPMLNPILQLQTQARDGFLIKIARYISFQLNLLLTGPVLARARAQNRGGIITAVGSKAEPPVYGRKTIE